MRNIVLGLCLLFTVTAGAQKPDEKVPKADIPKIESVVRAQLKAFAENDSERAFSFATPAVKTRFGHAAVFMNMVREGYAVLIKPASATFLEPAVIAGETIQPVRLVTLEGETWVALYQMERQKDGNWKIAGCDIAPSTIKSI